MQVANGIGQAKIILIGEHAVVYGSPAIALPIPTIQVRVSLTPRKDQQQLIQSQVFSGPLSQAPSDFAAMAALLRRLLETLDGTSQGFDCQIMSALPAERGMGSSAATATALTRAFFAAFNTKLTKTSLRAFVDETERQLHGNPSGIDAATTISSQPIWYQRGVAMQAIRFPERGTLVIADTGVPSKTKQTVAAVAAEMRAQPSATRQAIASIQQAVTAAKKALLDTDLATLGEALNTAQSRLAALGVSTPGLERLNAAARDAGALGAKLTGGGGGGCMLALAASPEDAESIRAALKQAGAKAIWQYDFRDAHDKEGEDDDTSTRTHKHRFN